MRLGFFVCVYVVVFLIRNKRYSVNVTHFPVYSLNECFLGISVNAVDVLVATSALPYSYLL